MSRKWVISLGIIAGLVAIAGLTHLTMAWLIPAITNLHNGGGY